MIQPLAIIAPTAVKLFYQLRNIRIENIDRLVCRCDGMKGKKIDTTF